MPRWRTVPHPAERPINVVDDGDASDDTGDSRDASGGPVWEGGDAGDALASEDVSDASFERRHRRFELDERRQRRRDQQYHRERVARERLLEAERRREAKPGAPANASGLGAVEAGDMASFWPRPQDVLAIQVGPHLPVTAFGAGVVPPQRRDFHLPHGAGFRVLMWQPARPRAEFRRAAAMPARRGFLAVTAAAGRARARPPAAQ